MAEEKLALMETSQLPLFLSIIVLILLMRITGFGFEGFEGALFACMSAPATYALAYYHAKAFRAGRFVVKKSPEPVRLWIYETIALLTSYVMGYAVYVAMFGSADIIVFTLAFVCTQVMRLQVLYVMNVLGRMGVDIQHPLVMLMVAHSVAVTMLVVLRLVSSFILG